MVIMPFEAKEPSDPRGQAGWAAEKQLAHYLDREFGNSRDILLFHGLRFKRAIVPGRAPENTEDFVQIDHLVLHPHGGAVIESKSVSGELRVDARGQWSRFWQAISGRSDTHQMPSPVEQARRQAKALSELLDLAEPPLLNKLLGVAQARFGGFPIRQFVAISEAGRFVPARSVDAPEVMKADQIALAVRTDIDHARSGAGLIGLIRTSVEKREATTHNLTREELQRIQAFLLSQHAQLVFSYRAPHPEPQSPQSRPVATPARPPTPAQVTKPATVATSTHLDPLVCIKCASTNIEVVYRRDYCILCADCNGYTALGLACTACNQRAKIRKQGERFFRDCDHERGGCGASTLFWINR